MLAVEPQIIETYVATGQVQLVFRPVLNHDERSLLTSEAAACALEQNQFWPMHELLFQRQRDVWFAAEDDLPALMRSYAEEIGLDLATFDACVDASEARALVQALDAEQRQRGIRVQPIFEISDQRLIGFQSFETFQRIIDNQ
ncbi:MAG: thioredoxin domain-containing protein [Chloroflexales bacterium]|nr:thioredoxin domain-containing protein [Chloroflexales bacterium]